MSSITAKNISPVALLIMLGQMGCKVHAEGDQLFVSNRASLMPAVVDAIKNNKAALLALVGGAA